MFIIRLGSTCSLEITSGMPPHKKLKTDVDEPELVNVPSESEAEAADFGSDWREKCKALRDKYSYALKNNFLTDVKLIVGEEATLFECHRLILALGSPVFEAMFFGEFAETGDTVTISDVDAEGFQYLIRFLYTNQCVLENDVTAFKTYFAADKYCVTELKKRCENFLYYYNVSPSNVWLFFENSLFLNSQDIKKRCLVVFKQHLKSSLEQSSFLDINLNTMECFLGLDGLNISEEKILKSVIQWAEHQSKKEGADSFENILQPLLSNICFSALTAEEFVSLRHNSRLKEVLNQEDSLLILEHLINPLLSQLPHWCCSKKQRYCEPAVPEKAGIRLSFKSRTKKSKLKSDNCVRDFQSSPFNSSSSSLSLSTSSDSSSSSSDSSD